MILVRSSCNIVVLLQQCRKFFWKDRRGRKRERECILFSDVLISLTFFFEHTFPFNHITGDSNNLDNDAILVRRGYTNHADAAESAALSRLQRLHDSLATLDEFTSEKRSAKRDLILRRLFRALTHYATGISGQDMVQENQDTIRQVCFHSIRIGQPTEQYAACRVIEATSVILGSDDQESWVDSLQKQIRRVIMSSKITPVRSAALRALSMAVCINSNDTHDTENLMDLCEEMFTSQSYRNEVISSSLRATAIDCWSLLATTIDDYYISGQDDDQVGRGLSVLSSLKDCLDNTDSSIDLRTAAGECIALIHEARLNIGINEHDDAVATTNVTARKFQRGSWDNSQWEDTMEEIKIRIEELTNQTGHFMSKQAKKEQRKTFREYMATICHNELPEEVLYFKSSSLTLTTWKEIIQLEFVRHCFQGGFQIQLLTNATLQAMFGFSGGSTTNNNDTNVYSTAGMSQLEKRLLLSKTSEVSKIADKKLNKDRTKRNNIKNHFLTVDDY